MVRLVVVVEQLFLLLFFLVHSDMERVLIQVTPVQSIFIHFSQLVASKHVYGLVYFLYYRIALLFGQFKPRSVVLNLFLRRAIF